MGDDLLKKYNFMKGELIEVKNDIGRINFISEEYITITTKHEDNQNFKSGYKQTNVVISNAYWKEIKFITREELIRVTHD
ncbi:MAG: hypothetical protein CMA50_02410 [Euryarchaeota archaeon]|nr:hypothetical protein [Euryarchaeota archaeon]|tara:strand:+ start:182 stop:421 length:240 start_codon:yes stop_codon:yes gene_type:complete